MLTFLKTVNKPAHVIECTNDDPATMHKVNGMIADNGFDYPACLITFGITCEIYSIYQSSTRDY